MGEINLTVHGKAYGIACDDGQEQRVSDLGQYVDSRLREIAGAGAASNESHLLVLTALVLADEVFELREALRHMVPANSVQQQAPVNGNAAIEEEQRVYKAIEHMAGRIDSVAERLLKSA